MSCYSSFPLQAVLSRSVIGAFWQVQWWPSQAEVSIHSMPVRAPVSGSGVGFQLQGKGPRPRVGANLTLCSSLPEDLFAPKDGSRPVVQSFVCKEKTQVPSLADRRHQCPMTCGQPEHGNPLKRRGSWMRHVPDRALLKESSCKDWMNQTRQCPSLLEKMGQSTMADDQLASTENHRVSGGNAAGRCPRC